MTAANYHNRLLGLVLFISTVDTVLTRGGDIVVGWPAIIKLCIALVLGVLGGGWQCKKGAMILHPVVCMAACFLTLVSIDYQRIYNIDLSVIVAQIMTGVGFLGTVVIWKEKSFAAGLTNAASLWVVAAIGMAVGYTYYLAAIYTTAISYFTLTWFQE